MITACKPDRLIHTGLKPSKTQRPKFSEFYYKGENQESLKKKLAVGFPQMRPALSIKNPARNTYAASETSVIQETQLTVTSVL